MAGNDLWLSSEKSTDHFILNNDTLNRVTRMNTLPVKCRIAVLWLGLLITPLLQAHPGGVDDNGGHVNRATGEYHCHHDDCISPFFVDPTAGHLDVVSFNIQFLGNFKNRDDTALAALLSPFDIVVVQELVAPPFDGTFPDGTAYRPDTEARRFFEAMTANGYDFILSEEDTGTKDKIHVNSTATEWWVTFYKPELVELAADLPNGFLAGKRGNHDDYERVPYAAAFRTLTGGNDFVLISVHLKPGDRNADKERREHELDAIASWVTANDDDEKDFFILGDMNFKNCAEIAAIVPTGFQALNTGTACLTTNTNVNGPKPYDNVLHPASSTNGLVKGGQFEVINLIDAMRVPWFEDFNQPYPGDDPYNHNAFRVRYSDHHPVRFRLLIGSDDD
ncbi:YHYH domain-containing protein [Sulfuriflexus mobilis]|uniref:YHYH domain-containing protein n=1 Tax=Sulfuriflexus mobilis TaxID=1811807 RepID=UPI0018D4F4B4|nr:YHYH domain-containing protein [Sulfuriflexus mobilis]